MPDSDNDSLFGYDIPDSDFLGLNESHNPETTDKQISQDRGIRKDGRGGDDLGLDEDLVVKTRKKAVKLTGEMLIGPKGIKKIHNEAHKKLRFKGKGYEYRDAARLLAYYRYWADDLFKKAKFEDTCEMVEKLGRTKVVKRQREEWIEDAAYPRATDVDMDKEVEDDVSRQHGDGAEGQGIGGDGAERDTGQKEVEKERTLVPDDPNALFKGGFEESEDEDMFDDEDAEMDRALEEMMKERRAAEPASTETMAVGTQVDGGSNGGKDNGFPPDVDRVYDGPPPEEDDDFEAEMEAMRDFM